MKFILNNDKMRENDKSCSNRAIKLLQDNQEKLKTPLTDERDQKNKKLFRVYFKKRLPALIAILIIIAACLIALILAFTKPSRMYRNAISLYQRGEYAAATKVLESLIGYDNVDQMLLEVQYEQAKELLSNGNIEQALVSFQKTMGYEDTAALINETKTAIFSSAVDMVKSRQYDDALRLFQLIPEFEGVAEYTDEIISARLFNGTWQRYVTLPGGTEIAAQLFFVINDLNIACVNNNSESLYDDIVPQYATAQIMKSSDGSRIRFIDNLGSEQRETTAWLEDGVLYMSFQYQNYSDKTQTDTMVVKNIKVLDVVDPVDLCVKAPKIGMSEDEVLSSSWGKPIDIKRTTTAYGTTDQWIYPEYRYIYLMDGVVTTIQD